MNRWTLPAVLVAALLVVSLGAAGAVAGAGAPGGVTAPALQEGDGTTNGTSTPTATPTAEGNTSDANATDGNATNASEEPSFGAVVSSFMQTTDADAETEVEDGLFEARFERSNASERAQLVRQRAAQLGDRVAELREERAQLVGDGEATVRERALAARLSAQSDSITRSVNETEAAAERANVSLNRTTLDELRTNARNLSGPEVAKLARGLVDGDDDRRGGPAEDRRGGPPGEDGDADVANESETADGDDRPGRSGEARGNSSEDGDDSTMTETGSETEAKTETGTNSPDDETEDDDTTTETPTPSAETPDGDGSGTADGSDQ